ncbi:hypothetical protein K2W90_00015 [Candidatus Babeliales bacterium]|nr:hypothetical protein [Candidatus Babeliales bacterium]
MLKKLAFIVCLAVSQLHGMRAAECPVLAVHGLGTPQVFGKFYKEYVAQQLSISGKTIVYVDGPLSAQADFGQQHCQEYFKKSYESIDTRNGYIIHATSQGTATVLNFLANNPEAQENLKALILEAPMASGNSAIAHHVGIPLVEDFPLVPYLAKLIHFPGYRPSGMQAIKSIDQLINKNIVIILAHSTHDRILPYSGACALYYGLKELGHCNVYFISKAGWDHTEVLNGESVVKTILAKHDLVLSADASESSDLSAYQPDHKGFWYRRAYKVIRFIEGMHTVIGKTGSLCLCR